MILFPIKNNVLTFSTITEIILNIQPLFNIIEINKGKEKYTNFPTVLIFYNLLNHLAMGFYFNCIFYDIGVLCHSACEIIHLFFIMWYLYHVAERHIGNFLLYAAAVSHIILIIGILLFIIFYGYDKYTGGSLCHIIYFLQYIFPIKDAIKAIKEKNGNLIFICPTLLKFVNCGGWAFFSFIVEDWNFLKVYGFGFILYLIIMLLVCCIRCCSKSNKIEEKEKELVELNEDNKEF